MTKSDRTRASILEAARMVFANEGYERATVRDIAAAASIDAAMIIRYFGSKEQLFAMAADFDLRLPDVTGVEPALIGETLIAHFLAIWEGEGADMGLAVLLRSAASNEFAATKLREIFARQVLPVLARIESPLSASDRAALVVSQILGLAFSRYVVRLPPVVALSHETIIRELGRTLQAYLTGAR